MDEKVIYWIVGLLIYYFIQSRKKSAGTETPDTSESAPSSPPPRTISFEDLLREIEGRKPAYEPEPERQQPEPVMSYEEEVMQRPQPVLEQTNYTYQQEPEFQKGLDEAFQRQSLEETMKLEQTPVQYARFKEYASDQRPAYAQVLAKEFEDRENLKKAFIMKEILDRRF